MPEPLHVAFVWHMHQPYYRSAGSGAFELPWARLHALKDYLDMVETVSRYPQIHQTFNLVPSLIEQLECYAAGDFVDLYWERTLKPAAELDPAERAFVVERMCEHPDHPRARSHPRYLELARKREAHASHGWEACARAFTPDELRDLQVWFNLAWFDPEVLEDGALADLVHQGRDFGEEDKQLLAEVQTDILSRTLPAYRAAAARGQIEISTSPYYHPILPLLMNSDSARISAADTLLPPRRFAHPEDAAEQVRTAVTKHAEVFGERPKGMWCSEQAVGEDVIPLLIDAGLEWTISDETVLARSLSGAASPATPGPGGCWAARPGPGADTDGCDGLPLKGAPRSAAGGFSGQVTAQVLHAPYRLDREEGQVTIVFRDHTLSDMIGFAYQSWAAPDAAADLLHRLRNIGATLSSHPRSSADVPLVTIALDGENAWEYYPRDGRDFLQHLYEGLSTDPGLRCVTISEHLREAPSVRSLGWLHTGSWIGGDLRTWSGDRAHNRAWEALHQARDLAASRRQAARRYAVRSDAEAVGDPAESAWRHIMIAEGSDWFWWFGDHHHSDLDHIWDRDFRRHLQEVYRILEAPVPAGLFLPLLEEAPSLLPSRPKGELNPVIDGLISTAPNGDGAEWDSAGFLAPDLPSTMQRAEGTRIQAVRFGWNQGRLCLLIVPECSTALPGLEIEIRVTRLERGDDPVLFLTLEEDGGAAVSCEESSGLTAGAEVAWGEVVEISLPLDPPGTAALDPSGLQLRIGRGGLTEHVFHTAGLASLGWGEQ